MGSTSLGPESVVLVNKKLSSRFFILKHRAELYDFILGSIKTVYNMVSSWNQNSEEKKKWNNVQTLCMAMMALLVCLIKPLLGHFPVWWHWQKRSPSGFGTRQLMKYSKH